MLAPICALVVAFLALLLCVLLIMKPKKLKLSVGVWKFVTFRFEADAGHEPARELPPGADQP